MLGVGAALWWLAWSTWRPAVLGAPELPATETWWLTAAALAGWLCGLAAGRPGRWPIALALLAVVGVAAAFSVWWWAAPGWLAGPLGLWCTGAVPVAAIAALAGSQRGLAAAFLGAALAIALLSGSPLQESLHRTAAAGSIAVIVAGLLLGGPRPPVLGRSNVPTAALATGWLAGIVMLDGWPALRDTCLLTPSPGWLPTPGVALLLGLGLGAIGACGRTPPRVALGSGAALVAVVLALVLVAREQLPAIAAVFVVGLGFGVRIQYCASAGATSALLAMAGLLSAIGCAAWLPTEALPEPGWPAIALVAAGLLALHQGPWAWLAAAVVGTLVFAAGVTMARSPALTELVRHGDAQSTWDRQQHELQFRHRGQVVEAVGAQPCHLELALLLARAFVPQATDTLLLGTGNPRLRGIQQALDLAVVGVDARSAQRQLRQRWSGDGPVAPAASPAIASADIALPLRQALRARLPGFAERLVVAEPIGADPALATFEFQALLRAAAGAGICVQTVDLRHVPIATLRCLCHAVASAHPWTLVYLSGPTVAWVSGVGAPPDPATVALPPGSEDARWLAYRCRLGPDDLQHACLGVLATPVQPAPCSDDALLLLQTQYRGDPAAALDELRAAMRSPTPIATARFDLRDRDPVRRSRALRELAGTTAVEHSVLLWHERLAARLATAEAMLLALGSGHQAAAAAAGAAAGFLHVGCPTAWLQAALGLPDRVGERVRSPADAVAAAIALDPTLPSNLPPVLSTLPWPAVAHSPLEDLTRLPEGAALAAAATGRRPAALALRRAFPAACARALLTQWVAAVACPEAVDALRELADPFVVEMAARALLDVGRLPEVLAIWRADLPLPPTLARLLRADPPQRLRFLHALTGRSDTRSVDALAELLVDADREIRLTAATALFKLVGDRIAYDPEWPESARKDAATRLRALHNRAP